VSISLLLYLAAFIIACVSISGKVPLWAAVILLCIAGLIQTLPV
jgi:hypothetical protein